MSCPGVATKSNGRAIESRERGAARGVRDGLRRELERGGDEQVLEIAERGVVAERRRVAEGVAQDLERHRIATPRSFARSASIDVPSIAHRP